MTSNELLRTLRDLNTKGNYIQVTRLYDTEGLPQNGSASVLVEFAKALNEAGRFFECDEVAQKALSKNPKHPAARSFCRLFEQDERRFKNKKLTQTSSRYLTSHYRHGIQNFNNGEFDLAIRSLRIAIDIAPDYDAAYEPLGHAYLKVHQYEEAISTLRNGLFYSKSKNLFILLSEAYQGINNLDEAISILLEAIRIHQRTEDLMLNLAIVYQRGKKIELAIRYFELVIASNSENATAFLHLGKCYQIKKDQTKAISFFQKAVDVFYRDFIRDGSKIVESNLATGYSYLGNSLRAVEDLHGAISAFTKAIEYDRENYGHHYNRAVVYSKLAMDDEQSEISDHLRLAYSDFSKAWAVNFDPNSYFGVLVEIYHDEYEKYLQNSLLFDIAKMVHKVRTLLATEGLTISHFTSLSVAKSLIVEESPLRLSEGTFLNDTSEGTELSRFLNIPVETDGLFERVIDKKFIPKWFIGSFVQESGTNDLTLWRMYGKEGMEEAQGCSITIDSDKLLESFNDLAYDEGADYSKRTFSSYWSNFDQDFVFYRVSYYSASSSSFIVPGLTEDQNSELTAKLNTLKSLVTDYSQKFRKDPQKLYHLDSLLAQIKYLIKTDDYKHEQEIRIIIRGGLFKKEIDLNFSPPKVYIKTFPLTKCITKITFGPKVQKPEEWASAFHYQLETHGLNPEIYISRLPFK
ncbi:tetratricopeptide repeat protein [Dyadobacter sp. OTU695]|uniref:tetratricopeptide repeat protein n=1 Tax=Dyadobacter sp. OTU695 TaxID=3043860 RepID=UPI00313A8042